MGLWNDYKKGGLGDYVHSRAENYRNYGIYRHFAFDSERNRTEAVDDPGFSASVQNAYDRLDEITNRITYSSRSSISELEDFYTQFFNQQYNQDFSDMDDGINWIAVGDAIKEAVEEKLGPKTVYYDKMYASGIGGAERVQYKGLNRKGRTKLKINTLKKLVKDTQIEIIKLGKTIRGGVVTGAQLEELKRSRETLAKTNKILLKQLLDMSVSKDSSMIKFADYKINDKGESVKEFNEIGQSLYLINKLTKLLSLPTSEDIGYIGEVIAAAGAYLIVDKKAQITKDMIKNSIVGGKGHGSQNELSISAFVGYDTVQDLINQDSLGRRTGSWKVDVDQGVIVSGKETQDTVDIQVQFENDQNAFGVDQLRASIKNYANPFTKKGVSIVSGVPLTVILSLIDSNFSNHYLNLLASAENGSEEDFKKANELITYGTAVRGVSGARTQAFDKLSQYLIIFARDVKGKQKVYIFKTTELLKYIRQDLNTYSKIEGLPGSRGVVSKANERVPITDDMTIDLAVQTRIARVIAETHKFKLSMSLVNLDQIVDKRTT